ncbi:MAG: flagellar filament capping protein FliD [Lachnospiraceae bacterium]|nr:flagellar filament capping protein FliD [Lachnospiraceae bacterium]
MAIRITGMYSGLDTESIITQLASAQSVKKNKLVKEQMKLSWKQDAWKALNTKIYSFYTNVLDNMRFQGSYMKKTTNVSNSDAVSVVTSATAPNSVQTMKISQLAKQGYLTGGSVSTEDGGKVTASSTLEDLGFVGDSNGEGKFRVKVGNKTTDITVTKDMKISDVVKKFEAAGLTASFDAKNQRFYFSSKNSGAAGNFTITGNDAAGMDALKTLGLVSAYDSNSAEYKEYELWKSYKTDTTARTAAEESEVAKRAAAKKASTDALLKTNEELEKKLQTLRDTNSENDQYPETTTAADLYDQLYGPEHEVQKTDKDDKPVVDKDGNPVMVKVRDGGLKAELDEEKEKLDAAKKELADLKKSGTATEAEIKAAEQKVTDQSEIVSNKQSDFNKLNGQYSYMKAIESTQAAIDKNNTTIADNRTYYEVDANGDAVLGADGKVIATQKMKDEVTDYFDERIAAAEKYLADAAAHNALTGAAKEEAEAKMATKIEGQDAEIYLNGVKYTNSSNTFEINGLTITAQKETSEEITLTTSEDTEGIYDMIKNFFTEYNKLINEMSSLYNAESSKGYEPLLSEEKAELADSEIEEWEKKIKDSLLRRDATLRDVSDAMKTVLMQGATVNGKTMYLADFGINTLGYFNAADNEKSAYHIDGDKDDSSVANNDDKLRQMIAADPETVKKFFTGLAENLHNTLADKMKGVANTSSAFTVYNDKLMQKEYDEYKDRIKTEETKLNDLMDKWYAKFSAMETAMAKLQSKNNAVASMFGGG